MIILGIDTATVRSSVCIADERGPLATAELTDGRAHAEFLGPAIEFCLGHSGHRVDQVTGVAVGLGPGLYTGLRVGVATATAFAHARSLPVVGVSSLDLVALDARWLRADRIVCPVLDARRGQVFWARYRPAHGGVQRISDLQVGTPEALAADLEATGEDPLCLGDGVAVARDELESIGAGIAEGVHRPDSRALVEIAAVRIVREETQRPDQVRPIYLREPDAAISWRHRARLHGGKAVS